jgi:hypothetical protein
MLFAEICNSLVKYLTLEVHLLVPIYNEEDHRKFQPKYRQDSNWVSPDKNPCGLPPEVTC